MSYDPEIHHRRSIRLREYDYSRSAAYFVTICTHGRHCVLGDIEDGVVLLNQRGSVVEGCWLDLPMHYPDTELDAYVIMPNMHLQNGTQILLCSQIFFYDWSSFEISIYRVLPGLSFRAYIFKLLRQFNYFYYKTTKWTKVLTTSLTINPIIHIL